MAEAKQLRSHQEEKHTDGRTRVVIEHVEPSVDDGRFPCKAVVGEAVVVECDAFTDGHDHIAVTMRCRPVGSRGWTEIEMTPLVNDRWRALFKPDRQGVWEFTIESWVDHFATWREGFIKKVKAGQDVAVDARVGEQLIAAAAGRAESEDESRLQEYARLLRSGFTGGEDTEHILDERLNELMRRYDARDHKFELAQPLRIVVDRSRAAFSTWYELFPRSASPEPGRHGTFKHVEARLPYVASMGFDVLYLPPIHPIGRAFRKGRNNTLAPERDDVGSPWAIGAKEGGHKSVHPELGTLRDFDDLVKAALDHGMEIALDIAFQCSPDHPYVKEHPEWFRHRPDGTIQYAENPPKKYQDIYPFDFETEAWESMWRELKSIFTFWIDHGVKIFRVDNPHTKAFSFWEWAIGEVKREHPDVLFLSEAFTRPKVMYRLAKLGFTQSYTYFAWRNEPWEIERYFTELTARPVVDFFRPNAWPNTPDILTAYLQEGGRNASTIRAILAATLTANYGIYGPAFELFDVTPVRQGSEEYMDSEKYQVRHWDLERPDSLRHLIARLNRIRREHDALQQDRTLKFHRVDNPTIVCYSKAAADGRDVILCVVNTDPNRVQWGNVELDLGALGLTGEAADTPYQVHDLLTDARYTWRGARNTVGLDPGIVPAHVFSVHCSKRTERDFEHFL